MSKKFKANIFSQSSIEKLKRDLLDYKSDLKSKTETLCSRLADMGVEIAKAKITDLDAVFTGELKSSIKAEQKNSNSEKIIFAVVADSKHAVYVEFGTGIVGRASPYPTEFPDGVTWQYASGKTIRQLADGRYGWFYQRDGKWYFTEGMPSRPFMYGTSLELQNQVVKVAKEVFS